MEHGDIWRGIDLLARKHGLSTSGLAKRAGLDATAFNKSKRLPRDGRPRWPSTESLARVLAAVGEDFDTFAALVVGRQSVSIPLVTADVLDRPDALTRIGKPDGSPERWIELPCEAEDATCIAVELTSDAFAPLYARGDRLIVSPDAALKAGNRVIAKPRGRDIMIGALRPTQAGPFEIRALALTPFFTSVEIGNTDWIARILWASQ